MRVIYNKYMIALENHQIAAAGRALALAFEHDPLFRYFFPAAETRRQLIQPVFELQIRQGLLWGGTFATSAQLEGIIIRLPSEKIELDPWSMLRTGAAGLLLRIRPGTLAGMVMLERALSALRKRNAPKKFAYIALLGVQPAFQGQGHGGRLLRTLVAGLDEAQQACYLETENERNVSLYQSFGFRLAEKTELPGGIPCWAMLRD